MSQEFILPSKASPLLPWVYYPRNFFESSEEHFPRHDNGKWMLFYPKDRLDQKWAATIEAFRNGLLGTVWGMKCSTLSPLFDDGKKGGVVILYCEDSYDRERILETGRQIAFILDYPPGKLFYKLDAQTTGEVSGKSLYRLVVPPAESKSGDHNTSSGKKRKAAAAPQPSPSADEGEAEIVEVCDKKQFKGGPSGPVKETASVEKSIGSEDKGPKRVGAVSWIDEDDFFSKPR